MAYDLTNPLVIGISSRALFNLEEENAIFEEQGVAAYEEYQVKHENDILQKGSAFQLVKAFLELNKLQEGLVEVMVMSHAATVEIYTPTKQAAAEAEAEIEAQLIAAKLAWTKQAMYWLKDAKRYQTIYEFTFREKRRP